MRPARLRWLTSIAVALTLVTAGPGVQAQDPAVDDFCALYTPEEVGDILGTQVAAAPGSGGCTWTATGGDGLISATAHWTEVSLADHKAAWPDGSDVTIGGRTAYYSPGFVMNELLIELDGRVLYLLVTWFEGDAEAALTELGELAVSRSGSLPPPPTPEPVPSFEPDTELEALFPETIGGQAVDVASFVGEQALPESARPAYAEALGNLGKTFDDLSFAIAYPEAGLSITAFRVAGADASGLLPFFAGDDELTPAQVAGKDVLVVDGSFLYPAGEVLWVVLAKEPALTEIFEALP